ncbi:MAG: hypothetical protein XE04_1534, partial [Marinimicrobia bacterium 46_43]
MLMGYERHSGTEVIDTKTAGRKTAVFYFMTDSQI